MTYLRGLGHLVFHIPNRGLFNRFTGRYNIADAFFVPGIPDLAVMLPEGKVLWIEVKSEKGKLSPNQTAFHERLRGLEHDVIVARRVQDVGEWLAERGYKR